MGEAIGYGIGLIGERKEPIELAVTMVPLVKEFAKLAAEWDTHYDELQAGLDALECPACGYEMRLWQVDGETAWSCMRRWREDGKLMMCSEIVEYEDAV